MERIDAMLERLPPVYRIERGSLLRGLLGAIAVAEQAFDEEMDRVQRSHWIETAFDREDLAGLAAAFDVPPVSWEPDELYRARIQAVVAAHLAGSTTRAALETLLVRLLAGVQDALDVRYFAPRPASASGSPFADAETGRLDQPVFREFPTVRRRSAELTERGGKLRPLDHLRVKNAGMDIAPLGATLWGMRGGRTAVPALVNLTTGHIVQYAGTLACGERLDLVPDPATDRLRAFADGRDATARLLTSRSFAPPTLSGASPRYAPVSPDPAPRPIQLAVGDNELWFLSVALFDAPGLDAALFAMASPELRQGAWGQPTGPAGTRFDLSVFHQPPAAVADLSWDERTPASFVADIPAAVVRRAPSPDAEFDRTRLFELLQAMVDRLRAAGVEGRVRARPATEVQPGRDRVFVGKIADVRESASPGRDALASFGALFDLTGLDGSRFS